MARVELEHGGPVERAGVVCSSSWWQAVFPLTTWVFDVECSLMITRGRTARGPNVTWRLNAE
ncbi:MAG: hypothetical protein ABIQ18_01010 [Umezawaea sp.]